MESEDDWYSHDSVRARRLAISAKKSLANQKAAAATSADEGSKQTEEWIEQLDPATGKYFYYEKNTHMIREKDDWTGMGAHMSEAEMKEMSADDEWTLTKKKELKTFAEKKAEMDRENSPAMIVKRERSQRGEEGFASTLGSST